MTEPERAGRADTILMLAVTLVGAVGLVLALRLPPSRFDPLGSGSVPAAVCAGLILLGGIGLARLAAGRGLGRAETSLILGVGDGQPIRRHPLLAVQIIAAVAAYCLALQYAPVGFLPLTAAFVAAASMLLSRRRCWRQALVSLAVGVATAGFLSWLFGQALRVALP